jgi:hypothetical protein
MSVLSVIITMRMNPRTRMRRGGERKMRRARPGGEEARDETGISFMAVAGWVGLSVVVRSRGDKRRAGVELEAGSEIRERRQFNLATIREAWLGGGDEERLEGIHWSDGG